MERAPPTTSYTRSAKPRRRQWLHDATLRLANFTFTFTKSIRPPTGILGLISLAAVLTISRSGSAQSNILGTSAFDSGTVGYSISQSGNSIIVSPVGYIASNGVTGHLIGQFSQSSGQELLKVTRISDDTFSFSTTDHSGVESSNAIKLSRAVGSRYYLLTGFRLPKQRNDSVALVDISGHRYYWFIIENPAQATIRESKSFYLGFQGDRIEHSLTNRRGLEFAAIRQTMNTPRTRIQLRSSSTGETRVVRCRWTDPDGILIPTRLPLQNRLDIGLGLYSPAKKSLIIPSSRGVLKHLEVPALRCEGYQAITSVSSQGDISALELCPSGAFFLSERGNNASSEDRIVSSGPLPAPLSGVRRADQTLIISPTGEAPVPIPQAGSNGSEVVAPAPAPTPIRNSPSTPIAFPTEPPADTATHTATATETPTETATYTATPGDTTAPAPGSFGTPTTISANGYTLNWGAATDDTSSSAELEYRVCSGSSSAEVDTIAECESATTDLHYSPNTTTLVVSGQAPGATRFYNVIVRDLAGNKSLYEGYTQSTYRWKALSTASAPSARRMHTGAWTGNTNNPATQSRLIIWGGTTTTNNSVCTDTGGIYDPATDSWQPTSSTGAPTARRWQNNFPVWTGATGHPSTEHRMIVWGGASATGASLGSGAIYNPANDSWTPMSTVGETPRDQFTVVWTGATGDPDTRDRMITWGATGAQPSIYDMRNNSWTTGTSTGAPSSRTYATAVWTGSTGNASTENRMIVWGGWPVTNVGGIYNPKTNTWSAMTTVGAPSARRWHTATWIGSKMVVYGGINGSNAFQNNGGIYDPLTDTWTSVAASGFGMQSMVSFWTGSTVGLVHWNEIRFLDPTTLTWTTYPNMNGVKGLVRYGAGFWTGSNFIMWGGEGVLGEGSIFYP